MEAEPGSRCIAHLLLGGRNQRGAGRADGRFDSYNTCVQLMESKRIIRPNWHIPSTPPGQSSLRNSCPPLNFELRESRKPQGFQKIDCGCHANSLCDVA